MIQNKPLYILEVIREKYLKWRTTGYLFTPERQFRSELFI